MRVWILLLVCGFAVASAVRYDDLGLEDLDTGTDPTEGGFLARVKAGFEAAIERIKTRLARHSDLAKEFGGKIQEIAKKVAAIGKDFGGKSLEKIREINRSLIDLAKNLASKIAEKGKRAVKRSVASEMHDIFVQIKAKIMTKEGLNEVKQHIKRMRTSHPALRLVRDYIMSSDDDHLHEILAELFKDIKSYKARYATELEQLFQKVGKLLRTREGFEVLYNYLVNLKSNHPLVSQLHMVLVAQDKEDVRDLLEELIDAFDH